METHAPQPRILHIVVASPGDVEAERNTLAGVAEELNRGVAGMAGLRIEIAHWETDAFPGFHPEGPQGLMDATLKIEDCDLLVGIFWKRFGAARGDAPSDAERDFRTAYEAWQKNSRPQIMVYFNQKAYMPKTREETVQQGQVLGFKDSFPKEGLWWSYNGKAQFERLVRRHLTRWIREQVPPATASAEAQQVPGNGPQQNLISHPRLFQAPPLPDHFIPRPEVMDDLRRQVLGERDRAVDTLVISALRGQGGIGKSTLAAALAQDSEVQSRFADGILWVTLGQKPDLLSLLSGWVQALGNDAERSPVQATSVPALTSQLRSLLHDRAALLVVDDVWNSDDARVFLAGGSRCRMVVTTRRAQIADDLHARSFELDVMTREQSLGLFASRLDRALEGEERSRAARLARALGYLPLALELAAVRVSRGVEWDELRGDFEQEVARLDALRPPGSENRLEASFNLSLDALRARDASAWEAFVWLGVLPEDVTISAPMAATLWERDEAEAAELLEWLWNDALLLSGSPVLTGQRRFRGYRLHDLLHDMARRLLIEPPPQGLGMSLPQAHARLLERYRARCGGKDVSGSRWHGLADDSYIHGRLVWHMAEAQQFETIVALLREETEDGQNAWYTARERLGQTAGFIEDVARAWKLARERDEQCIKDGKPVEVLGLEVRLVLMMTSLNSLAANIPVGLLKALLVRGVWSPAQAMAYAQRTPDRAKRAGVLSSIAEHLPESHKQQALDEALATARAIGDESSRARALSSIAEHLPPPLLSEALATARAIGDESYRAGALLSIIAQRTQQPPALIYPLWKETLQDLAAGSRSALLEEVQTRLAGVIARLGGEGALTEVVQAVRDVGRWWP